MAVRASLRLVVLTAFAVRLGACAALPPASPVPAARAADSWRTAASFEAPLAAWPADAWWRAYGDRQLDGLIDEALAGSPTLVQAQARLARAQAGVAEARSHGLPSLTGNASVEEMKQSYNLGIPPQFVPQGYNDYGAATLNFTWELDFWGKNRAAVASAASEARAAQADAAEARLMLTTNIAADYARLAQLFADRDVSEEALKVREETAGLVRQRVENGLDTQAELQQALAGPPQARAQTAAIDEEIAETRNALAALTGAGPDRGGAIARPPAAGLAAFGLPDHLAADLIGRRPDVVAAKWRAEAATHRVAQAKAVFYPDINLTAFIGVESLYLRELTASGSDIGSVGPALSLPVFEGGRLRANLRGADADRDAAVAAYDEAVTEALHQVADVAADERSLAVRLEESRQALAADENAWRIARLRYGGGLSTFQAVLLAEDAVLVQRRTVSDLESRAFELDVALVRALGGGFSQSS